MRTTLDRFHIGAPTEIGPLTLFPVWTEGKVRAGVPVNPADGLRIAELPEPAVPYLMIGNPLPKPVVLTEGTVLHGGRQTRVLQRDVYLPAAAETRVDVNCVEQGRWSGGTEHAVDGRVPTSILAAMRNSARFDHGNDRQDRVWLNVARVGERFGHSETASLRDLRNGDPSIRRELSQHRAEHERQLLQAQLATYARRRLPGQSGVLIGVLGHPISLEIIPSPVQFGRNLGALLAALALDVAGLPQVTTPGRRARKFAEHAMDAGLVIEGSSGDAVTLSTATELMTIQTLHDELGAQLHTMLLSARHELVLAA